MFNSILGMKFVEESTDDSIDMEQFGIIECVDDPEEGLYRIALETQMNWQNIIQAVALDELAVMESTGAEMVYEAGKVSEFFETAKRWLINLWEKIQGVFKKVFYNIEELVKGDKAFVEKYDKVLKEKGSSVTFEFKGYNYIKLDDTLNKIAGASPSTLGFKLDSANAVETQGKDKNKVESIVKEWKEKKNEFWGAWRKSIVNESKSISNGEFKNSLYKYFRDGGEKITIKKFKYSMLEEIKNAKDLKKSVKGSYDEIADGFKKSIKELDALTKKAKKLEDKNEGSGIIALGKIYTEIIKGEKMIANIVLSENLRALNQKNRQNKAICAHVLSKISTKDKPAAKNESASLLSNVEFI